MSAINPFLYTVRPGVFNLRLVKHHKYWRHYLVDFPVVAAKCYPGGEVARGEYFEPVKKDRAPLAILIHGWGNHSVWPFKLMIAGLIHRGIACFILYLPFHPSRLPAEMKSRLSDLTADEWFTGYQVAVTDVRHVIDWAGQNERIDNQRVAVIGLSLGAFIASMAMGTDPCIKAGVFLVHGGNTGKIMQTNSVSKFGRRYRVSYKEYQEKQKNYAAYLTTIAANGFNNVIPGERSYLIDPLTYATMLKGRPLLMINALWDEIMPQETSKDFWRACGECERAVLPATHASIWLWYPLIMRKINRFLKSSLLN